MFPVRLVGILPVGMVSFRDYRNRHFAFSGTGVYRNSFFDNGSCHRKGDFQNALVDSEASQTYLYRAETGDCSCNGASSPGGGCREKCHGESGAEIEVETSKAAYASRSGVKRLSPREPGYLKRCPGFFIYRKSGFWTKKNLTDSVSSGILNEERKVNYEINIGNHF